MAITYDAVNDYNFVGDGATSNDTPWANLKTDLQANRDEDITVNFDAGHYVYSNNRGLFGCGKVTLVGAGKRATFFQNNSSDSWAANHRPFNTKSIFLDDGDAAEDGNHTFVSGYLIEDATEGASSVTLVTAGEASNFSVGERCLIHGFDQQGGGFPPNLRYFQYVSIIAINSGVLSVSPSLNYTFLADDWPSITDTIDGETITYGKARIIPLERTNFYQPEYIEFKDLHILKNPNVVTSDTVLLSAHELRLTDVIVDGGLAPSESQTIVYTRTECFGGIEGDKLVHSLTVTGGRSHADMDQATGINEMIVENHIFDNCLLSICAAQMMVRDNLFLLPAATDFGAIRVFGWSPEKLIANNNLIVHDGDLKHAVNTDTELTLTPDSTSGNNILVDDTNEPSTTIRNLRIGTVLYEADMSDFGEITAITHDGSSNYVLAGDWSSPTGPWKFNRCRHFEESGSIFSGGNRQDLRDMRSTQLVANGESSVTFIVDQAAAEFADEFERHHILGIPTTIRVDITQAYGGAELDAQLRIGLHDGTSETIFVGVSLTEQETGFAEITTSGTSTDLTTDTLTQLDGSTAIKYLTVYLQEGQNPLADLGDAPIFTVTITVTPIVTWNDDSPIFGEESSVALIEHHAFTEADFTAAAQVGTAFDPNTNWTGASRRWKEYSDGNILPAPHNLIENAKLSERTSEIPSGWAEGSGFAAASPTWMDEGGYNSFDVDANNDQPFLTNVVTLEAGKEYTLVVYIHSVTITSGDNDLASVTGTSGTDALIEESDFTTEGWYGSTFKMGAADTSATVAVGLGLSGVSTGSVKMSRPAIIEGRLEDITLGAAAKLSGEPLGEWLGGDDGDEPIHRPRLASYDGGSATGLYFEGAARTNLLTYSEDLSQVLDKGSNTTVTLGHDTGPDGNTSAARIEMIAGSGTWWRKTATLTAAEYTATIYYKLTTGSSASTCRFGAYTGALTGLSGSNSVLLTATSEWQRAEYTFTGTAAVWNIQLDGVDATTAVDVMFWGITVGLGGYSASYAATGAATYERVAETLTKAFSHDISAAYSKLITVTIPFTPTHDMVIAQLDDGSDDNDAVGWKYVASSNKFEAFTTNSGGNNGSVVPDVEMVPGQEHTLALTIDTDDALNASVDGTLGTEDTTADWPLTTTPDTIRIGNNAAGDSSFMGFISEIAIWPDYSGTHWLTNPTVLQTLRAPASLYARAQQ